MSFKQESASANHVELSDLDAKLKTEHISDVEAAPLDEEWFRQEKSVVRKLDLTLLPIVWVLYMFNYLDRNNIA
jgi:hypothetical protein